MRSAGGGRSDQIFTSRTHVYQSLFDSVEGFDRLKHFVFSVLTDILPRASKDMHYIVGEIGQDGFIPGQFEWLEARLIRFFTPGAEKLPKQ